MMTFLRYVIFLATFLLSCSGYIVNSGDSKVSYTTVYSKKNQGGSSQKFMRDVDDLYDYGFDNKVYSVKQTGFWTYFENTDYNKYYLGDVYWIHGIDYKHNLDSRFAGKTSSLRYSGNVNSWNEDSFSLYEFTYFSGDEYYGNRDTNSLGAMNAIASSVVVNGNSPWTVFSGTSYQGIAACIYPRSYVDYTPDGKRYLSYGIVTELGYYGWDNQIQSVKKGCNSANIIRAKPLKALGVTANGAWGMFNVTSELRERN